MRKITYNLILIKTLSIAIILLVSSFPTIKGYDSNRMAVISFTQYDYVINYNGTNYIVIEATNYSIYTLGYYQLKNVTQEANKTIDEGVETGNLETLKQYIEDTLNNMSLKPHKIYIYPKVILVDLYFENTSIIEKLWDKIGDKVIEYNAFIIITKTLSPPEYIDLIKQYGEKVISRYSDLINKGIPVTTIGFGYSYYDAVYIGINMTNPSKEYIMNVVKSVREIVDDPRIPVIIQFKEKYIRAVQAPDKNIPIDIQVQGHLITIGIISAITVLMALLLKRYQI
jgi:hypothetical protein